MANAGRPPHLSLSKLLYEHPELQREVAKLIAQSQTVGKRAASKFATFRDMRKYGAAVFAVLNYVAEDCAETLQTDGGITLNNSWKVSALAAASKDLYERGRDALGIPGLAPIKGNDPKGKPVDWRRSLVEVEAQTETAGPDPRDEQPRQDETDRAGQDSA